MDIPSGVESAWIIGPLRILLGAQGHPGLRAASVLRRERWRGERRPLRRLAGARPRSQCSRGPLSLLAPLSQNLANYCQFVVFA